MDERKRIVIFQRRMQIQRICVTICTGSMLLLCAGTISYFGNQDRHENALLDQQSSETLRLREVKERGSKVMTFCAVTLLSLIGLSAGAFCLLWRCPECNLFFGLEFTPEQCPRCRSRFLPPGEKSPRR